MRYEIYIKNGPYVIEYVYGTDDLETAGREAYSIWVQNKAVQLKVVDTVMKEQLADQDSPFINIIKYNC